MKEEQVISELKRLKTVLPPQAVLNEMKHSIYRKVGAEQKKPLQSTFMFALPVLAFVLLLVIFISSLFLTNQLETAILYSKMSFASNQYQKARIAFADITNRFHVTEPLRGNPYEFSHSLAIANTELSNLKLKGEKGKYTEQECRQIYHEYLSYLKKEEKNIPVNNSTYSSVRSQISTYEEQAEKKLHMYKSV